MNTIPETPRSGRLHTDASTELSARRTGMSFQRTRLSADRTLMSVIRTALSLIGFGFTIFQFFHNLQASDLMHSGTAPRHFGQALVWLGITILVLGIAYHVQFMLRLRNEREQMRADGLIHGESGFPVSLTLIVAVLLLLVGVLAVADITFGLGPFG